MSGASEGLGVTKFSGENATKSTLLSSELDSYRRVDANEWRGLQWNAAEKGYVAVGLHIRTGSVRAGNKVQVL